jgi:hypothetical protein
MKSFKWPDGEEVIFIRPPKEIYTGKLENYYHPDSFPELAVLKSNWEKIRDEIFEFEKTNGSIKQMDSFSPAFVEGNSWNAIILKNYNWKFFRNIEKFPFIYSIVDSIPNCTLAAVSKLEPFTCIKPHHGETNGAIRVHLGLDVPGILPDLGIRVGGEENCWKNGELICYPDIKKHEVWNNTPYNRYILIIDIVPAPLINRINEICSKALGNQSYIFFYQRFKLARIIPYSLQNFFVFIFSIFWKIYLKIQAVLSLRVGAIKR